MSVLLVLLAFLYNIPGALIITTSVGTTTLQKPITSFGCLAVRDEVEIDFLK